MSHPEKEIDEEIKLFEKKTDNIIRASSALKLSPRGLLTILFLWIDTMVRGEYLGYPAYNNPAVAEALASRFSYLIPLLKKCTSEIDVNIRNPIFSSVEFCEDFQDLISYGHFHELMPEVWKNYYNVRKNKEGFELVHPHKDFTEAEEYDIILTELSLTFLVGEVPDPLDLDQKFIELASQVPNPDIALRLKVLTIL